MSTVLWSGMESTNEWVAETDDAIWCVWNWQPSSRQLNFPVVG